MTRPGSRLRQASWMLVLGVAFALFVALNFHVRSVQSEVVRAERRIIALRHETDRLQTEFETRANMHQLAAWNAIDFGYAAPRADQFLDGERQLAQLGVGRGPGAPSPLRLAHGDEDGETLADSGGAGDDEVAALATPRGADRQAGERGSDQRHTSGSASGSGAATLADAADAAALGRRLTGGIGFGAEASAQR